MYCPERTHYTLQVIKYTKELCYRKRKSYRGVLSFGVWRDAVSLRLDHYHMACIPMAREQRIPYLEMVDLQQTGGRNRWLGCKER